MTGSRTTIHLEYFARLKERRGVARETISTASATPAELFEELSLRYGFQIDRTKARVAVNETVVGWDVALREGDRVVFLTPFGGG